MNNPLYILILVLVLTSCGETDSASSDQEASTNSTVTNQVREKIRHEKWYPAEMTEIIVDTTVSIGNIAHELYYGRKTIKDRASSVMEHDFNNDTILISKEREFEGFITIISRGKIWFDESFTKQNFNAIITEDLLKVCNLNGLELISSDSGFVFQLFFAAPESDWAEVLELRTHANGEFSVDNVSEEFFHSMY